MTSPTLSLVAPCLNEQNNVAQLAERFFAAAESRRVNAEVVYVDDGSTDETRANIELLSKTFAGRVRLVVHQTNLGISKSWFDGVTEASGEFVCLIDADLQNRPESVFDLLRALEEADVHLARGVRIPVSHNARHRVFLSRGLNRLLNLLFKMNSRDNKSGFILCRRADLLSLLEPMSNFKHFQTFIGVSANNLGLSIAEIDTPFEDRRSGESFLTGRTVRTILDVLVDINKARKIFPANQVTERLPK